MGWFCAIQIERSYEDHESKSAFVRILITPLSNVIHAIQSPGPYQYKTHLRESLRRTASKERNLCCNACLLAPPVVLQYLFSISKLS